MLPASAATLQGELLRVSPYQVQTEDDAGASSGQTFLLEVADAATSPALLASLSLLDRLLGEGLAAERERRLSELVDFMSARLLVPGAGELAMAQRLAQRHARILNEFGYYTAAQLAEANGSQAQQRSALVDNWRKRRQVFAVPHPDRAARERDVYPAFQFVDHKPVKAVQQVLHAFGPHKAPWKLALWFTSNNGLLPDSARPVDLLGSDPQAVIGAAQQDAQESAA